MAVPEVSLQAKEAVRIPIRSSERSEMMAGVSEGADHSSKSSVCRRLKVTKIWWCISISTDLLEEVSHPVERDFRCKKVRLATSLVNPS